MPGTYHHETTLPSRRRCVERVRGVSFRGARLWEAWQSALCHCPHDAVKVSHQLCTLFCVVNPSKHKISPCNFWTLSIDASGMGLWRWMICNASFGSCIAMDFSGRHGRTIFLLWDGMKREIERVMRSCLKLLHYLPTVQIYVYAFFGLFTSTVSSVKSNI